MSLPLQPNLQPSPAWFKRLCTLGSLIIAVALIGLFAPSRTQPDRLLLTAEQDATSYLGFLTTRIRQAQSRIWMIVYVMRMDGENGTITGLTDELHRAHERGVDVRVLLDIGKKWGSNDIEPKHADAHDQLARLGIPVYLDEVDRTTHIKGILFDNGPVIIGSHNWTRYALTRNREASIASYDSTICQQFAEQFIRATQAAEPKNTAP